jgi:[acyl-carrier-protein] S-malonyltransferase
VICVFPGQGAQSVGMGRELAASCAAACETFAAVDEALGMSLGRLCFEGPEETLRLTENAQPAILATSVAAYRALEARSGLRPLAVAGHSLGEWSALVAAGALDLGEAARAVRERGRLMQEAVPVGRGAMAAVMGLDEEAVAALCRQARGAETLAPANLNGPGQTVVAGHAAAVDRLLVLAKDTGGRAQRLAVSAPFHCALMQPAADGLAPVIDALDVRRPTIPVVSTVEPRAVEDPEEVRRLLKAQVTAPVRWGEATAVLRGLGATVVLECGPGRVLSGLLRRADRTLTIVAVGDGAGLARAAEALA